MIDVNILAEPKTQRQKLTDMSLLPTCFCDRPQGQNCPKHSKFEPTVEELIFLLEDQVNVINDDEQRIGESLDFLGKSMDTIMFSRKDTFKEQINRAYANKDEELEYYKNKCHIMEQNDKIFHHVTEERDMYKQQVDDLMKKLNKL